MKSVIAFLCVETGSLHKYRLYIMIFCTIYKKLWGVIPKILISQAKVQQKKKDSKKKMTEEMRLHLTNLYLCVCVTLNFIRV